MLHRNDSKNNAYRQEPRNVPRSFYPRALRDLSIIISCRWQPTHFAECQTSNVKGRTANVSLWFLTAA